MSHASIVIPTYNRPKQLRHTLRSLTNQSGAGRFEVIVVDDGSATDTRSVLQGLSLDYSCQYLWQRNDGFRAAKARNTGILFGGGETIIFLDDDMVVQSDFVEAHLDLQLSYDETAVIGMRHRVPYSSWADNMEPDLINWSNEILLDPRLRAVREPQWERFPWAFFSTCNASVARRALLDAGLFDEGFQGWGFEDSELAYRLQAIGMRFRPLLEPVPYHLESPDCDMTEAESPYHLPPDKMSGYRRNSAYFAGKFPDDKVLQRLLQREGVLRMLAAKTIEYVDEDGSGTARLAEVDSSSRGAGIGEASAHRLDPLLVPQHLSLLTPYDESDERADGINGAPDKSDTRLSLLDELQHDFGIAEVGRGRFGRLRVPEWAWTVAFTPLVVLSCVGIVSALVLTGRYRRIFRRKPS